MAAGSGEIGASTAAEGAAAVPVKLWDLPVRLVHWSFVALLPALWWTAENGKIDLHLKLGMVMLILVLFRILWGLFGSSTARFASFVRGPVSIARYMSGRLGKPVVGHNPLGALSVVALLLLLLAQTVLGLFASDTDGLAFGPLNFLVGSEVAEKLTGLHHLGFNVILAVVVLHVAAVLFYLTVKRDNLIGPMITGRKRYAVPVAAPKPAAWWRAVLCLVVAWGIAGWAWSGAPGLEKILPEPPAPSLEF
ncbi:MAG: cytochrome b/b6 domain-containing protein [Novosphingobium sp.]